MKSALGDKDIACVCAYVCVWCTEHLGCDILGVEKKRGDRSAIGLGYLHPELRYFWLWGGFC